MIITVPIDALGNMLETMVRELAEKTAVTIVSKVLLQQHRLFQQFGYQDTETTTVRVPGRPA